MTDQVHLAAIVEDGILKLYPPTSFNSWYIKQLSDNGLSCWELWVDNELVNASTELDDLLTEVGFQNYA